MLLAPENEAGSGASNTEPEKKPEEKKQEAKELDKQIAAVEKKIEKAEKKTAPGEIAAMSESTGAAILETLKELRTELADLKKRRRWLLF